MKTLGLKESSGLTLLEILIAVSLFTGVALITAAALRTGLHAADSAGLRMASLERTRTALEVISSQVESAITLSSGAAGSKKSLFRGERQALTFPTGISIWEGSRGNVLAEYRIEPEGAGTWKLVASETVVGTDLRRETVLLKGLSEAGFSYASVESEPGTWEDSWTHDLVLPRKVRISLKGRLLRGDFIIPIRTGGT